MFLCEKVADSCELQIMKIKGSHSGVVRTEIIRGIEEFWWNDPIPLSSFNATGRCTFVHQDDELHLYGFPSLQLCEGVI